MALIFVGACAGSTGGGMKVSRILLMAKNVKQGLFSMIHPRGVRVIQMDGKRVGDDVMNALTTYVSVSYTHLDVYKRQEGGGPGGYKAPYP